MARLDLGRVKGDDGFSPTVETSKSGKVTTITITDEQGPHVATILDGEDGTAASGDMKKEVYDTNDNGIVDNAEKVNNHTVLKDVPADAVFTDTVFSGNYNDLTNKPTIPSKTSDLTNDSGFITGYTETDPTVPSHVKGITQANITSWNNKSDFSGDYDDLTNKPDLTNYVTNTDYASYSNAGVIKMNASSGLAINSSNGVIAGAVKTYSDYNLVGNSLVISKGTLENVIAGKGLQIQLSTMPTASADYLDKIVQFTGTTDSTYTNGYFYKCVSDGQDPATYSWEEVEVQAGGGGASYTAGTNMSIDSNNAINCTIPYNSNDYGVSLGNNSTAYNYTVAIGRNSKTNDGDSIAIGSGATTGRNAYSIAIGASAKVQAGHHGSIALGNNAFTQAAAQCVMGGPYSNQYINEIIISTSNGRKRMATEEFVTNYLTTLSTYDATKTQVLKNVNGILTWIDE